jgi:hypothetical protein
VFASANDDTDLSPTTYNSGSAGTKAVYLLLRELGYGAHRWEASPGDLKNVDAAKTTLITHHVMILPSMANIVRGVDAETGAALWQTGLGRPINGGSAIDMHNVNDHWEVLSTGVVDPDTKRVYLVAWISPGRAVTLVYPKDPTDPAWSDEDFGSAGGTLIAQYGVYLAAGKDGIGYSVNTHNFGHTQPADFGNAKANCAKLRAPPVWIAASPGPVDPCPQNQTTLDFMPWVRRAMFTPRRCSI